MTAALAEVYDAVSLPSPPSRMSAPLPPAMLLLLSSPVMVSLKLLPSRFSMLVKVSLPAPPVTLPISKLAMTPAPAEA
ncbi:MAG: hypothetical protein CTY16_17535 [Methylobacter sp.]|nr:MAG: hypothetical protein CTY16_17535 [Methylobacter sp.]